MPKPYHLFKYNAANDDDFTIIAHRGASAYYPENTIASFEGAIALGADMVELDVQLTSDHEVVAFHDETIGRCTDGRGRVVACSLEKLKSLDAGGWFDGKFRDEKVPTLAEVLDVCKDRIAVNIEIKTEAVRDRVQGGIEEKCLTLVLQYGMKDHVVFSSFDPRAVAHLKEIDADTPVAVLYDKELYGSRTPSQIVTCLGADAFNCAKKELSDPWMADLKGNGIPVNIYTVNDDKTMKRLLALGVNGMFTNKPDILKSILEGSR
ncbi:MAG: glycerophosphodiester phosphodiesterase family protein [Smithellaceae bacterium]